MMCREESWKVRINMSIRANMSVKAKRVIDTGVLVLLILGATYFSSLSVREYLPYVGNQIKMERLQKEVAGRDDKGWRKIDWKKLQKKNGDIIAWIEVPGTKVDYPVVKCQSLSYYLHHDVDKKYNILGSVFVQPDTAEDFSDIHTVIYGHNMRDKQMFGSLHSYESERFWKKHKEVCIYQPGRVIQAKVYSVYDTPDGTDTYRTEFDMPDEWKEWIAMTLEKRYYDTGIQPQEAEQIITLSTCSNGRGRKSRYVVNCVVEGIVDI